MLNLHKRVYGRKVAICLAAVRKDCLSVNDGCWKFCQWQYNSGCCLMLGLWTLTITMKWLTVVLMSFLQLWKCKTSGLIGKKPYKVRHSFLYRTPVNQCTFTAEETHAWSKKEG